MASRTINILLSSFSGLGVPPTLSLPTEASTPISDFTNQLTSRLPSIHSRLILTTTSNTELQSSSSAPISSLLSNSHDAFLPLRLTVPLCGGKGGFGSQLRAAGGRMSSRRKKNAGENNSSNRNLDGRRLRTVNEAKALAEYLALKPEMEKKEKEARRKRWEQVVEIAERREQEIRSGSKGKVDGKWVEEKEEAGERAREAVLAAMKSGNYHDNLGGPSSGSAEMDDSEAFSEGDEDDEMEVVGRSKSAIGSAAKAQETPSRTYFGFDEDDDSMSDDSRGAGEGEAHTGPVAMDAKASSASKSAGKGKAKL